jgi:peroxiredoxin/outer membrane lipoprotein-sorting protein
MKRTSTFRACLATIAIPAALFTGFRAIAAPDAEPIFAKARKAAAASKSLKASIRVTIAQGKQSSDMTGSAELLRPNYGRIAIKGSGATARAGTQRFISTGKKLYIVADNEKKYMVTPAEPKGENLFLIGGRLLTPVVAFTDTGAIRRDGQVKSVGSETRNGKAYRKVVITAKEPPTERAFFFGASGLLEGIEYAHREESGPVIFKVWLEKIVLNPPLAAKQFAYSPPVGFKLRDTSNEGSLLAIGAKAPEFSLPGAFGGKYSLKDLRKGKKATLISFWFHACGPCRMELPVLAKEYPGWKKRGLALVAINTDDPAKLVQQYIFEEKLNYPVVLAVDSREKILKSYKIEAFPTAYLLDQNGNVIWRKVGFDPDGLETALDKALK